MARFEALALLAFIAGCTNSDVPVSTHHSVLELSRPSVELGINDEFARPVSATRLSNGNIVVADAFAVQLFFFDSVGNSIRTVGRQGGGPGEFRAPGWVLECEPDTLFVFDAGALRFTVLDTAGTVIRQFNTPQLTMLTCRDGLIAGVSLAQNAHRRPNPSGPRDRITGEVHFIDTTGDDKKVIGPFPIGEYGPLAKVANIALTNTALWYGSADSAVIERFTRGGKHVRAVSLDLPVRKATEKHWSSDVEEQVSGTTDKETRDYGRQMLEKFSRPDNLPAYRQIISDTRGNVWISHSFPGDSTTNLRVVSPEGEVRADVSLPQFVRVLYVGDKFLLGSYDANGQPRVVVYPFVL